MEEVQALAPETATDAPEIVTDAGQSEPVAETEEEKQVKKLAQERAVGERAKRNIQKRFDQMTAEKRELMDMLKQQQELLNRTHGKPQSDTPAEGAPRRDQYSSYEDYLEARAAHKAEKAAEERFQKLLQQQTQETQRQQQQRLVSEAVQRYARETQEFAEKTPDFEEVTQQDIQVPDNLQQLLPFVPNGAQVLYAIGKNPALATKLNEHAGNPAMLLFLMGQIASSRPTPQTSKAPPPGKPVGARGGADKDVAHMTADEYYAHITKRKK